MKIVDLTAVQARIPLKKRIRHASHDRAENDTLLVRCTLDDGSVGWGEGLPRPYVTGETIETAWDQFRSTDLRRQLGEPFDGPRGAIALGDRLTLAQEIAGASRGHIDRGCFGNSVRCAIELAILDAACRSANVPLSSVTALVPESAGIRKASSEIRYSGVVTAETPFRQWVSLWKLRLYRFAQVKLKVGVAGADDAALVRAARRVLGAGVELRLDANEAWSCAELESKLAPLRPFGVVSIEQPVPHAVVDGLSALCGRIGVPIMLDESLCGEHDARRAIERGTCDLFNLRLSKCGGFVRTVRLAAMAHRAGLEYQLGCQVGETGILSAAGRHFAASVDGLRAVEGSYDRFLVRERLTVEDVTFVFGGKAPALERPGLGVTIDETALKRVERARAAWQ